MSDSYNSEEGPSVVLWDWPMNNDGFAKCCRTADKIEVALDFDSLRPQKVDVKTFNNMKSSGYSCSVGLCSPDPSQGLSRLEIQTNQNLKTVMIEAFREIARNERNHCRRLRSFRKVYKLPSDVDMSTVRASVEKGFIFLQAMRRPELVGTGSVRRKESISSINSLSSTSLTSSVETLEASE